MNFLRVAEEYAQARGDDDWFKNIYTAYRNQYSVKESVRMTLMYLYNSEDVVNQLEAEVQ